MKGLCLTTIAGKTWAGESLFLAGAFMGGLLAYTNIRNGVSPELVIRLTGWAAAFLLLAATRGVMAVRPQD